MPEYIEREALLAEINDIVKDYVNEHTFATDFAAAVVCELRDNVVSAIPAADVATVVHGRWVFKPFYKGTSRGVVECNLCKGAFEGSIGSNYCPNCGARMDGE